MTEPNLELQIAAALDAGAEVEAPPQSDTRAVDAWTPEITRRQRVLLHAEPIFRMKIRGDARMNEEHDLGHYDSMALVFKIFDLVLETMGLEGELDMAGLAAAAAPLLRAMDDAKGIAPSAERHQRAIDRVLGWLLNEEGRREPFEVRYLDFDDALRAETRLLPVTLMTEQFTATGNSVPRLSPEAMNLYLNAIDFPIQDQQLAMAAMIRAQIARGRLTEAEHSARAALALSVQYREQIEVLLRATQRDIHQVDWRVEVPAKLDDAIDHVRERVDADRDLMAAAEEKLNNVPFGSAEAQQIARVIFLIERCFKQHVRLQDKLMTAMPTFLDEHDRQAFRPRMLTAAIDLSREVLEPLMRVSRADVLEMAAPLIRMFSPVEVPTVLWLDELVTRLLAPRREPREHTVALPERDVRAVASEPVWFDAATWAAAGRVLEGVRAPIRLAELINDARADGAEEKVVELVALRALYLYAPGEEETAGLRAEKTGERFSIGVYHGDNLMLRRLEEDDAVAA